MSHPSYRANGFTLIEIMVTCVIIALAATLVSLSTGTYTPEKIKSAAHKIHHNIQTLQSEAQLHQILFGMTLNAGKSSSAIENTIHEYRFNDKKWVKPRYLPDRFTTPPDVKIDFLNLEVGSTKVSNEISIDNHYPEIIFFPDGGMSPFSVTIKSPNQSSVQYKITSDGINSPKLVRINVQDEA